MVFYSCEQTLISASQLIHSFAQDLLYVSSVVFQVERLEQLLKVSVESLVELAIWRNALKQRFESRRSSGEIALERSSRLHKKIVGISVVVTTAFGFLLAALHPGISAKSTSTSATSTPSSGVTASGLSPNSTAATLVPVPSSSTASAPAPVAATGGS